MAHVTVPSGAPAAEFTVGGTPTTGPWTIPSTLVFFDQADLRVMVGSVELAQNEFSVVGDGTAPDGYAGGELTVAVAISSTTIQVWRDTTLGRDTDFVEGAPVRRADLNTQFDLLASQVVDLNMRLKRGVWTEPLVGSEEFDPLTPAARANKYPVFDAGGDLTLTGVTPIGASFYLPVATYAAARALFQVTDTIADGTVVYVYGTGISGAFLYDSTGDKADDDGGTILAVTNLDGVLRRDYEGYIEASWFEPANDGTTDDSAVLNAFSRRP